MEGGQMELLVGSMKIVIWQAEPQHQAVNIQQVLDHAHHRNGPALTFEERGLAPDSFERLDRGPNGF